MSKEIHYVGWGGKKQSGTADLNLGWAIRRRPIPPYGLRRAIFDIAWGYVNGFELSAIAYYVLTRSLSQRAWHRAYFRENPDATHGCGGIQDRRPNKPSTAWCRKCYPKGTP